MSRIQICLVFILIPFIFGYQSSRPKIKEIEIYALEFGTSITAISKEDVKKQYEIYIKIQDIYIIQNLNIDSNLNHLTLDTNKLDNKYPGDYRALVIIHFDNGKNEKMYIDETGFIYINDTLYYKDWHLIAKLYSFLPRNFDPYGQFSK